MHRDAHAEAKAIRDCYAFVVRLANRYANGEPDLVDDLIQEGLFGVLVAFRSWRPDGGANLLTWAAFRVKARMRAFIGQDPKTYRLKRKEQHASLDEPLGNHGSHTFCLYDLIPSPAEQEERAHVASRERVIAAAIDDLPERTAQIIRARFFEDKTLEETAEPLGLTKERVRQIQDDALRMLARRIDFDAVA